MRIKIKKISGVSLVEVMLSITILFFVSYAGLLLLGTSSSKGVLVSKKMELIDALDHRVNDYVLSGSFDDSSSGSMTFVKTDITNEGNNGSGNGNSSTDGNQSGGDTGNATGVDYNLYEFTATNTDYNITVNKKVFEKE